MTRRSRLASFAKAAAEDDLVQAAAKRLRTFGKKRLTKELASRPELKKRLGDVRQKAKVGRQILDIVSPELSAKLNTAESRAKKYLM